MIHIEEEAAREGEEEGRADCHTLLSWYSSRYGCSLLCVPLEQVFEICSDSQHDGSVYRSRLKAFLAQIAQDQRADIVALLRARLIAHVARLHGFRHVVFGHNSSKTAIQIMSDIAKGRGQHVPLNLVFVENLWNGWYYCHRCVEYSMRLRVSLICVCSLRVSVSYFFPLRDQSSVAIALYHHYSGLYNVQDGLAKRSYTSVNQLTHGNQQIIPFQYMPVNVLLAI